MASGAYTHAYTHTHTHARARTLTDESDYKKPGAPACGRRAWFKNQRNRLLVSKEALIGEHNLKPLLTGHKEATLRVYQHANWLEYNAINLF